MEDSLMSKELFVALEGIDGSGTTTLLKRLKKLAERAGVLIFTTCEPFAGSETEKEIRARLDVNNKAFPMLDPLGMQTLFIVDRFGHIKAIIRPKLEEGYLVISDRYFMSTLAYGMAFGLNPEKLLFVHQIKSDESGVSFVRPNLTFLLDLPAKEAIARKVKQGGTPEHFEKLEEDLLHYWYFLVKRFYQLNYYR